ncbi:hypothetical protein PFISCL1PPCAC_2714, partial [Pristionchus fissidentatus]
FIRMRITSDGEWQPWYSRRVPPVFCLPCLPAYVGLWTARKPVLIIGGVLFMIGVMILLALLLMCIAVECSNILGGLLPLAIILIIVGILLFHCGWAAHLLDERGQLPIKRTVTTTTTTVHEPPVDEGERRLLQTAHHDNRPPLQTGYWQFDEEASWQAVANPYPIQSTLKPCLDRMPY